MEPQDVIFRKDVEELNKRFILKKSEKCANRWQIFDKEYNIIYSFLEKDYFRTLDTCFLNDAQQRLSDDDKMHLRYDMEYWFLMLHHDMAYPDEEFTFQLLEDKQEGYYKITHNHPLLYEVIVKDEGFMIDLAKSLRKLADLCEEQDKAII